MVERKDVIIKVPPAEAPTFGHPPQVKLPNIHFDVTNKTITTPDGEILPLTEENIRLVMKNALGIE